MTNEYYLIHKSILPECFLEVIETRELIEGAKMSVSDACKITGISRSTFYKYKDYIFTSGKDMGAKAIISLRTVDHKGILGSILNVISNFKGNVITINQDVPIKKTAYINICLSVIDMEESVQNLIAELSKLEGVKLAELLAIE